MPKSSPAKLKYMKEYNKKPEVAAAGVARRRAQRHAIANGTQKIGDGVDLDHKRMLAKGGSTSDSNVRPQTQEENRAWRKNHPEVYGKRK